MHCIYLFIYFYVTHQLNIAFLTARFVFGLLTALFVVNILMVVIIIVMTSFCYWKMVAMGLVCSPCWRS